MASIDQLRASDGSGNAQVATVQSTRTSGSSTLIVDTVAGINDTFIGSMGTPHTFTDPITSEEITVISEATAVDFAGHVDGSNLEIDDIAPGYVDGGSEIGDIVIIKPTTQYADALADVLEVIHNDDGTLKNNVVNTADIVADAVTADKLADASVFPANLVAGLSGSSWTPATYTIATLTNAAIGTGGGAVKEIDYMQIGKYVICRIRIILGSSGQSMGSGAYFTLPVTAAAHVVEETLGAVSCLDGAAGYAAAITFKSTTEAYIRPHASSGNGVLQSGTSSLIPFTWGAGDGVHGYFMYRAA